jgi:type IV pilus assembly protein PilE
MHSWHSRSIRGFTLIELMIAVAVIGILAAIAYPSYQDSLRKSRRSDAINALGAAQLEQEKWRTNNTTYGTLANIGISATSSEGYYAISVAGSVNTTTCAGSGSPSGSAYAIRAEAVAGTSQANDTGCTVICADQDGMYPAACIRR